VRDLTVRSLAVEIIILFVAAVAVLEIVSLGYRYIARTDALASLEAIRIADNISVVTSLIEKTAPAERTAATQQVRGSSLYVSWDGEPWLKSSSHQNEQTALLHDLLAKVLERSTPRPILVGDNPSHEGEAELAVHWKRLGPLPAPIDYLIDELATKPTLLVSVPLDDGTWLNFVAAHVESIEFWPLRSIALLSFSVTAIVALSIWAIRRLTAPFAEFAAAARRLGADVNATPIEEHGPSEVRAAIHAFNMMQQKLRRFIEDRTQMLAAVSHDLRTPMTRLRLRAECLSDRTQCASMLRDLGEMESMIAGVLTFAKDDVLSEPTILVDLAATSQSISDEFADAGFKVSFAGFGRLPYPCRPVAMRRCLTNLVENAVKYGRGAELSMEVTDTEVMIHVDDSGPGIPEAFREEVFRPFFRLEGSRSRDSGGSGLGLTIARNMARAHGGDVVLSARAADGLRVTVVLPQSDVLSPPDGLSLPVQRWDER
jgi:signal transduction histidine kinase